MLTVQLQGGLGNQLFQLAFLEHISKKTGRELFISSLNSPQTVHSREQYFETIFKNWKSYSKHIHCRNLYENSKLSIQSYTVGDFPTCFVGYFQRYEYVDSVRDNFINRLSFDYTIIQKYPDIHKKIFIHVRGGDYRQKAFHLVDLTNYYKKCIEMCSGEEFVIFTNDIPYANELLPNIPIISESEVDSLLLMSKCKGGICANSSFSWWGAYLNSNRMIYLPSRWVNDENFSHEAYRVPGWLVI
jgi:hypothetical protein